MQNMFKGYTVAYKISHLSLKMDKNEHENNECKAFIMF